MVVSKGRTWCEGPDPSAISRPVFANSFDSTPKKRFFISKLPNSVAGRDLRRGKPSLTSSDRILQLSLSFISGFFALLLHRLATDAESGPPTHSHASRVNHPAATSNLSSFLIDLNWILDCHLSAASPTFHSDVF